jgi:hypothetical protein
MSHQSRHHAYLDRIEDGIAVLLLGEDEGDRWQVPARYLPAAAREGQALAITFAVDAAGTEARRTEAEALIAELARRSGSKREA